jgi:hypothetical protein
MVAYVRIEDLQAARVALEQVRASTTLLGQDCDALIEGRADD